MNGKLLAKDSTIFKMKMEAEKLNKSMLDVTNLQKNTLRQNEEIIARKTKEVEALLKEKKCKNCILCLEDIKDKPNEYQIKDLNDKLIQKTSRIVNLEE